MSLNNDKSKLNGTDYSVLKTLIRRLQQRLGSNLKEVWLFGSRARGDHLSDSDYDILIVAEGDINNIRETAGMTYFAPDGRNADNIKLQAEERLSAAKELFRLGFYNDAISRIIEYIETEHPDLLK